MKRIATSICLGLGDNIVARIIFDTVKHEYEEIKISHDKAVQRHFKNGDLAYDRFLKEIGNLLFTEPPYRFDSGTYPPIHTLNTVSSLPVAITKPNLIPHLCRGTPLDLGEEYIVVTTKIRGISKKQFIQQSFQLWKALNHLSKKYKIVILGEREVERSLEYSNLTDMVYEIYSHIVANIPPDRVVDLTVPALGNTAPSLLKIQQDGLIMQQAKAVLAFGLGGNVWLAAVTSTQLFSYRDPLDRDHAANLIMNPRFSSIKPFKDWNAFIQELERL